MEKELLETLSLLKALFKAGQLDQIRVLVADLHPADLAELMEELTNPQRAAIIRLLNDEVAALVVGELDPETQAAVLSEIEQERASDILDEMSADDVADLVDELPEQKAEELLRLMEPEYATDVRELLEYEPDTAGGIMTTEYVAFQEGLTAQQAIDELRRQAPEAETTYYVYVVSKLGQLVGVLSLRELIIAHPATAIQEILNPNIISVKVSDDQEQVARVVAKYDLLAVPVVDDHNVLLGIVTVDDVVDVLQEEATEDIYRLTGTAPDETHADARTPWGKAKKRLPWLVPLLFGEIMAGVVLSRYDGMLQQFVVLSSFIPVIMGMGGNVATQTLAIAVRGLATGELDSKEVWWMMGIEVLTGVGMGIVCGVVALLVAVFWKGDPRVGVAVGGALAIDFLAATALATIFPFVLERFKIDPAVASGPFVTTMLDIIGMAIYMQLAGAILTAMA